ncbi:MAG TPA: acyl carrier protein, partial [Kofleriaceae bacterium]|nr:acyl carrier protein [Kofleriaceae bacterium]
AAAVVVADLAWPRFAPRYAQARRRPLIADLAPADAAAEPTRSARELAAAGEPGVLALVTGHIASVLGVDAADVTAETDLLAIGFDSLRALELRNRLARAVDRRLPITLAFDHPTPRQLARALLARLDDEPAPALAQEAHAS